MLCYLCETTKPNRYTDEGATLFDLLLNHDYYHSVTLDIFDRLFGARGNTLRWKFSVGTGFWDKYRGDKNMGQNGAQDLISFKRNIDCWDSDVIEFLNGGEDEIFSTMPYLLGEQGEIELLKKLIEILPNADGNSYVDYNRKLKPIIATYKANNAFCVELMLKQKQFEENTMLDLLIQCNVSHFRNAFHPLIKEKNIKNWDDLEKIALDTSVDNSEIKING